MAAEPTVPRTELALVLLCVFILLEGRAREETVIWLRSQGL